MKWEITDPESNETLTVEGDVAPDATDADEIFFNHRQTLKAQEVKPSFGEQAVNVGKAVGGALWEPFGGTIKQYGSLVQTPFMLKEAEAAAKGKEAPIATGIRKTLGDIGIGRNEAEWEQLSRDPAKEALSQLGRTAQIGAYAIPFGGGGAKVFGATIPKVTATGVKGIIGKATVPGFAVGAIQGGAEALKKGKYGDIIPEAVKGGAGGAVASTALYGMGAIVKALKGKTPPKMTPTEAERVADQFEDTLRTTNPRSYTSRVLQQQYNISRTENQSIGLKPYYWEKLSNNGFHNLSPDEQYARSRAAIDILGDNVAKASRTSPAVDGGAYLKEVQRVINEQPQIKNTQTAKQILQLVRKAATGTLDTSTQTDVILKQQRLFDGLASRAYRDPPLQQTYRGIGDAAQDAIFNAGEKSPAVEEVINTLKSPAVQETLRKNGMVGLADDLMQSIGIQDVRSAMAPFVKQIKAYDLLQIKGATGGGIGKAVARGVWGPLGDVVTPLLNAANLGGTAKLTGNIASIIQGVQGLPPATAKALAKLLPTLDSKTALSILSQLGSRAVATPVK
jgi:hypothetical protein